MIVVTFETSDGKTRYYLADDNAVPVQEVLDYLRFEDNRGLARNTLRLHCIHMKHFYSFLEQKELKYTEVTVDHLAAFIAWLKYPRIHEKVIPLLLEPAVRAQTINANIDTVLGFYNYLSLHDKYENQLSQKLIKFVKSPQKNYRSFLNGIADKKREKRYLLHLPVPRQQIKTVAREDVNTLIKATGNIRDYFLLYLLFETGMRIGEALSLWLEDFDISACTITIHDRGEMENLSEIKTVSSPRKLDCTQDLLEVFTEYVCYFHTEGVKTNHVFVKMMGKNAGKAMDYADVDNLFRKLRKKTGIYVTPHMFRHTSLSMLNSAGWEPELLRIRAGHKNIYTTLNTYVHPSDDEISEAFKRVSDNLKMPGKEASE
ncbi:MAG: tyrosine-type recombinase/integrase [Lachnospiraceae bacterium]|nr:tyrosine-type recombinase/integrase [Lachnospiraceae bacterium]